MIAWLWLRFATPRISQRLLKHLDETLVEDVRHHWIVFVVPFLVGLLGLLVAVWGFFVTMKAGWFLFGVGGLLMAWAGWKALNEHMDRLVLTNMRVFRVRGVIAESAATMPLARVLDITVKKTVVGRMLGYGHFTFESAAQEQGLREIHFVPRPDRLDLLIQEQVQQAGLRGRTGVWQAPGDVPMEVPRDTPGDTSRDAPGDTPGDSSSAAPGEVPDEVSDDAPGQGAGRMP